MAITNDRNYNFLYLSVKRESIACTLCTTVVEKSNNVESKEDINDKNHSDPHYGALQSCSRWMSGSAGWIFSHLWRCILPATAFLWNLPVMAFRSFSCYIIKRALPTGERYRQKETRHRYQTYFHPQQPALHWTHKQLMVPTSTLGCFHTGHKCFAQCPSMTASSSLRPHISYFVAVPVHTFMYTVKYSRLRYTPSWFANCQ